MKISGFVMLAKIANPVIKNPRMLVVYDAPRVAMLRDVRMALT